MIKTIEGSRAIAEQVVYCEPEVVACYPITPSTHIAEELAKNYADGKIKKFIAVEAEFSAISALIGASAAGARTFSTTSGQGLLLMHEPLLAVSGMRLPIVMVVANRAVSSPLNIWNDEQDTITQRDAGWIQLYAKNNQEAVDLVPIAFKVAEQAMLPAMVCLDGFILTHAVEQIDIIEKEDVKKFLPEFNPEIKLDPENPLSLGVYAGPAHYQDFRKDLEEGMQEAKKIISKEGENFGELFGKHYNLILAHKCEDAERIIVGIGSLVDNAIEVANELREKGEKVGVLHVRTFRPFPREEIRKELEGKIVGVIERDLSLGASPPIYSEVSEAMQGTQTIVSSFVGGLGGKTITRPIIRNAFEKLKEKNPVREWIP